MLTFDKMTIYVLLLPLRYFLSIMRGVSFKTIQRFTSCYLGGKEGFSNPPGRKKRNNIGQTTNHKICVTDISEEKVIRF